MTGLEQNSRRTGTTHLGPGLSAERDRVLTPCLPRGDLFVPRLAARIKVVPGPLLQIGNTTSRVEFGTNPGEWVDALSAFGVNHHWALGTGHRAAEIAALAALVGLEFRQVSLAS